MFVYRLVDLRKTKHSKELLNEKDFERAIEQVLEEERTRLLMVNKQPKISENGISIYSWTMDVGKLSNRLQNLFTNRPVRKDTLLPQDYSSYVDWVAFIYAAYSIQSR